MKNTLFIMIALQFLEIAFSLYERLQNPVQKSLFEFGGKRSATSPRENEDLRFCKKYLGVFQYALDVLASIPIEGMDPSIIMTLSNAFKSDLEFVVQSDLVTKQFAVVPSDDQGKRNRFVLLANEAITLLKNGCNVSGSTTQRLVHLATNATTKGKGFYGIESFNDAAKSYLRMMSVPSETTTSSKTYGQVAATELQKRFDAMRGIKPLPISPTTGKPMMGPELATYLQAKLDALRSAKGGYRRKTHRRRKMSRRHRRTNRR